jgi:hypothetical protein
MVYASISGIAAIENARALNIDKPRSLTFDVSLYFGGDKVALAALTFYNATDMKFSSSGFQVFQVDAQVCCIVCRGAGLSRILTTEQ